MMIKQAKSIAQYLGVHPATVKRWIDNQGFPASKQPNGDWMTTDSLIDQWILARAQQYRESRKQLNGHK